MPIAVDITLARGEDIPIVLAMNPPTDISTWQFQWEMMSRYGGTSGLIVKSFNSGYMAGQSGVTVTNSGQGIMQIQLNNPDTSGMDFRNYAWQARRLNSGFQNVVAEGYVLLTPSIP